MSAARIETGRRSDAAAPGAAGWLGLAAAPTFAVMALLTYVPGGNADMMCSAAHGASALSGMVPMYVLMSAFHSVPEIDLPPTKRCLSVIANGFWEGGSKRIRYVARGIIGCGRSSNIAWFRQTASC